MRGRPPIRKYAATRRVRTIAVRCVARGSESGDVGTADFGVADLAPGPDAGAATAGLHGGDLDAHTAVAPE